MWVFYSSSIYLCANSMQTPQSADPTYLASVSNNTVASLKAVWLWDILFILIFFANILFTG